MENGEIKKGRGSDAYKKNLAEKASMSIEDIKVSGIDPNDLFIKKKRFIKKALEICDSKRIWARQKNVETGQYINVADAEESDDRTESALEELDSALQTVLDMN